MILERIDPYLDMHVAKLNRLSHIRRYAKALEFVKPPHKVLDAGCGYGYGSKMLAEQASKVVAIDESAETVSQARERYAKENLEFVVGDLQKIDLHGFGTFDVITFFEVIEHINNPELVLQKFKEVMSPEGYLLISTPNGRTPYVNNPYHTKEFTEEEVKDLLNDNGFFVQEVLGQYPILGGLVALVKKMIGSNQATDNTLISSRGLISSIPFVPEIFSELYGGIIARKTSRQLFYVSTPRT